LLYVGVRLVVGGAVVATLVERAAVVLFGW
jgi:hypothetical protein